MLKLTFVISKIFVTGLEEDTTRDAEPILAASVSLGDTTNKDTSGKLITIRLTCAALGFVDITGVRYMDTVTTTAAPLVYV